MDMIINLTQFLPCQLKCKFCINNYLEKPHKVEMFTLKQFKEVVNKCIKFGFRRFDLTPNVGDFLLDPKHIEKLKYLENRKEIKWYGFVTNYLNPSIELLKLMPHMSKGVVEPSIYGFTQKQYYETTGQDLYYQFKYNMDELAYFIITMNLRNAPIRYYIRSEVKQNTQLAKQIRFIVQNYGAKIEWKELINRNWGGLIPAQSEIERPRIGVCVHALNDNGIFPNGDVTLCNCWDTNKEMIIGNIYEQPLEEIFSERSDYGIYLKEQMCGIYKGICKNCDDLTIAGPDKFRLKWHERYKKVAERMKK